MGLFDRSNEINRMANDPQFLFRVGRLLGATEMAGHILQGSDIEANQRLGTILLDRLAWFPTEGGGLRASRGMDWAPLAGLHNKGVYDHEAETVVTEPAP